MKRIIAGWASFVVSIIKILDMNEKEAQILMRCSSQEVSRESTMINTIFICSKKSCKVSWESGTKSVIIPFSWDKIEESKTWTNNNLLGHLESRWRMDIKRGTNDSCSMIECWILYLLWRKSFWLQSRLCAKIRVSWFGSDLIAS